MNQYLPEIPALPRKKNGLAIASMVLGIVSVVPIIGLGNPLGVICGLVGVVLGAIGSYQIKNKGEDGKGSAITGIILGSIGRLRHYF